MEPSRLVALDLDTCLEILRAHEVGRIALTTDSGPVIVPVNYRLVETLGLRWIALRTEAGGLVDEPGTRVAFEIDEIGPGRQGRSVLVRGTLERIDRETAGFGDRFDSEPWLPDRDSWLVIEPYTITGRELQAGEREWAFSVGAYL
jgi:nitroimidazol reductase NimA-like FMN-containing flavoprotein (pyridoxamine 5'-phosphate oxidase superfamily)